MFSRRDPTINCKSDLDFTRKREMMRYFISIAMLRLRLTLNALSEPCSGQRTEAQVITDVELGP